MKLKYRNGGKPDMDVKSLLAALGGDDKRGLNKLLNQEYREEMRSDDPGEKEMEGEGGGMDKERMKKILKALAAGTAGFGAMVGIPEIVKLLKRGKSGVESDALYHNVLDPMPDRPNIFLNRTPDQSSRGRGQ